MIIRHQRFGQKTQLSWSKFALKLTRNHWKKEPFIHQESIFQLKCVLNDERIEVKFWVSGDAASSSNSSPSC